MTAGGFSPKTKAAFASAQSKTRALGAGAVRPKRHPRFFVSEPHQPEMCNFKPNVILNIDDVWEVKRKAFEVLAAQKHLWEYSTRVALNRGMQGGRNSGRAMTYGEAYQRLFPMIVEELA